MTLVEECLARGDLRPAEKLSPEPQKLDTREHRDPQLGDGLLLAVGGLLTNLIQVLGGYSYLRHTGP